MKTIQHYIFLICKKIKHQQQQKMETEKINIQEALSLGYVYLLVIGLVTDNIFYSALDINIMNYSNFLDILTTPINLLINNYIIPITLIIIGFIMYYLNKYQHQTKEKKTGIKISKFEMNRKFVISMALLTFGFYVGLGWGMASGTSERIKKGEIKPLHEIIFNNGKQLKVRIIGQNSAYIFYVPENTNKVIITPITNTIFQIKKL